MKVIIEDNISSPISLCLKVALGDALICTGGNELLSSALELSEDEDIYCFVDVSPENTETIDIFFTLSGLYSSNTVHILPIPCMEWCCLSFLLQYNPSIFRSSYAKAFITIRQQLSPFTSELYKNSSLENFCKQALGSLVLNCTHSKFWTDSCFCDNLNRASTKYCKESSILNKSLGILYNMCCRELIPKEIPVPYKTVLQEYYEYLGLHIM